MGGVVLPVPGREELQQALQDSAGHILVRTAHPYSDDMRAKLTAALQSYTKSPLTMDIEVAPDLGLGVELIIAGNKVAWSLPSYLNELETQLTANLAVPATKATVGLVG